MSERKSFIEIYDEANMGNRVNIILDNFPYFNRIIDSYENCIRDKICDERSSNARSSYGECGIRVQTSGFSDITCNTAIKNEEIDRALLNDDYKTAVKGTDDRFKYQRELEIIKGMRIDYEKVKEACGMLPGKDYAFYMNYLSGKKDTVQIAEEEHISIGSLRTRVYRCKAFVRKTAIPFMSGK